jgi:hypothetical protein
MIRGRVWGGNIDVPRKGENSVVDPQFYVIFFSGSGSDLTFNFGSGYGSG